MKNKEIISQLESLKENSRSFLEATEPCSIWQDDIEALDAAIAMVKSHPVLEKKVKGIGRKKELAVLAVKELARRLMREEAKKVKTIHGPEDVARFVRHHFWQENKERFSILLLNTKNHIIGLKDISIGSLTASIVHPREVFETAILHHAAAIILLHNHPSGDPTPSREDIKVTERLVKASNIMDIPILDHIILGNGRFVSMKEKDLLQ